MNGAPRPIPVSILRMVEFAFGPCSELMFVSIPFRERPRYGGHKCIAQVSVKVGPDPGDNHHYHASGRDCLEAINQLLGRSPSKFVRIAELS